MKGCEIWFINMECAQISFDGWDNIAQHPLLNIILACPSGNVSISTSDTIKEQKDAHYICNAFARGSKQNKVYQMNKRLNFNLVPLI